MASLQPSISILNVIPSLVIDLFKTIPFPPKVEATTVTTNCGTIKHKTLLFDTPEFDTAQEAVDFISARAEGVFRLGMSNYADCYSKFEALLKEADACMKEAEDAEKAAAAKVQAAADAKTKAVSEAEQVKDAEVTAIEKEAGALEKELAFKQATLAKLEADLKKIPFSEASKRRVLEESIAKLKGEIKAISLQLKALNKAKSLAASVSSFFKKLGKAKSDEKEAKSAVSADSKAFRKDFNEKKKDIMLRAADVELECLLELNETLETCRKIIESIDIYMSSIASLTGKTNVLNKFLDNMLKDNKMFPFNITSIKVAELADLLDMIDSALKTPAILIEAVSTLTENALVGAFGNINALAVQAIQEDEKHHQICLALIAKDKEIAQLAKNAALLEKKLCKDSPVKSPADAEAEAKAKRNEKIQVQLDSISKSSEQMKKEISSLEKELAEAEKKEASNLEELKRKIQALQKKVLISAKMSAALNIERLLNEGRIKQITKEKEDLEQAVADAWKKYAVARSEQEKMKEEAAEAKANCNELELKIMSKVAEAEAKLDEAEKKLSKANTKLSKFYADAESRLSSLNAMKRPAFFTGGLAAGKAKPDKSLEFVPNPGDVKNPDNRSTEIMTIDARIDDIEAREEEIAKELAAKQLVLASLLERVKAGQSEWQTAATNTQAGISKLAEEQLKLSTEKKELCARRDELTQDSNPNDGIDETNGQWKIKLPGKVERAQDHSLAGLDVGDVFPLSIPTSFEPFEAKVIKDKIKEASDYITKITGKIDNAIDVVDQLDSFLKDFTVEKLYTALMKVPMLRALDNKIQEKFAKLFDSSDNAEKSVTTEEANTKLAALKAKFEAMKKTLDEKRAKVAALVSEGKELAMEAAGVLEEVKRLSECIQDIINEITGFMDFFTELIGKFTSFIGGFSKLKPTTKDGFTLMFDLVYMFEALRDGLAGAKGCCNGTCVNAAEAIAELIYLLYPEVTSTRLKALRSTSLEDRAEKKEAEDKVIAEAVKEGKTTEDIDETIFTSGPYTGKLAREELFPNIKVHPFGIGSQMLLDQMLKTLYEVDWMLEVIKMKLEPIEEAFAGIDAHSDAAVCFGIGIKLPNVSKLNLGELKMTAIELASLPARITNIADDITKLQSKLMSAGPDAAKAAAGIIGSMFASETAVDDAAYKSIRAIQDIDEEETQMHYKSHKLEVEFIQVISKLPPGPKVKVNGMSKLVEKMQETIDKLNPFAMMAPGESCNDTNTLGGWIASLIKEAASVAKEIGSASSKLARASSKMKTLTTKVTKLATDATDPKLLDKMLGNAESDLMHTSVVRNVNKALMAPSQIATTLEKAADNVKKLQK